MNILADTFKYFAKYPSLEAVEKFFNRGTHSAEYQQLYDTVLPLTTGLYPDITDYIFGVNEDSVKKRIASVRNIYLFVDYGNITSVTDNRDVKRDEFNLAITIAKPTATSSFDQAEELLISDKLLQMVCSIRRDMREDRENAYVKRLVFPNEISPFFARELSNSYGWTLMFKMNGIDMI